MIAQQDASIAQELQENNRDIGSEGSQHIETPYESLSSAEEFSQSWESLL